MPLNAKAKMRIIKVPKNCKLTFVGDIHEQEGHFDRLLNKIKLEKDKNILVSLGDVYDKGNGIKYAESIINKIKNLYENDLAYFIRGNHEQRHIRISRDNGY